MSTLNPIVVSVRLTEINCGQCGGTYAINARYRDKKHTDGGYWHCPYCNCSWGYGESENDRLKKTIEDERKRTQAALSRENELRADRDTLARKLKRVDRGVCPECNRTFANLARHMSCKHKSGERKA